MDIYGNKLQLSTIVLAGFAKFVYAKIKLQQKLTKSGNTMSGALDMGGNRITGVLNPASAQDASTKIYADSIDTLKVAKAGDVMRNNLDIYLNKITDVAGPVAKQVVVTKNYLTRTYEGIQKFWVVYGNPFPARGNTIIGLITLHTRKNIINGKIIILKIWVDSATDSWMDIDCDDFKSVSTKFHVYDNSNILGTCTSPVIHHQGRQENTS